jgi:hypothetical protein
VFHRLITWSSLVAVVAAFVTPVVAARVGS